jgi:arylsulfatase A-like enzyme
MLPLSMTLQPSVYRVAIVSVWAIAAAWAAVGTSPTAAADRPNVLFIAVDDLNDWIGCLGGHPDAKTPNIDRLAARGVNFTRAYCAAPACNPSRAALLTGRRPSTSGVYHNNQPWRPVMRDVVTLPQYFSQHGYRVVGGGKIYHNAFNDQASWDHWQKAGNFPQPDSLPHNGIAGAGHFDWGPVAVDDAAMGDHATVDWAINELKQDHDRPLFLACGFIRPHLPFFAPAKYFEQFPREKIALPEIPDDDLADIPAAGRQIARPQGDHAKVIAAGQHRHAVQAYLACIAHVDYELGRLLAALDASSKAKNTIVVLWGDHGWHLGEKQHWRKFALWEEATRVPLLIAAPGVTEPRGTCGRPVTLMDLYPTLADLCGLPIDSAWEGNNLKPLLASPEAAWPHAALTTHGKGNHAVRTERWRYIRYADGSEELYDHDADPQEWKNLASEASLADVKAELAKHFPAQDADDAPTQGGGGGGKGKGAKKKGKVKAKAE